MALKNFLSSVSGLIIFLLILTGCGKKESAWISYSKPEKAGFSTDSLRKVDQLIKAKIAGGFIPGGAALVAKDGKIIYEVAYGYRDIDSKTPLEINDIFRMASMTKPITSVAIMQLYEKGKLKLTDPVSKYIPSFANPKVLVSFSRRDSSWTSRPASRELTIHDLLTHTSGIQYGFADTIFSAIYAKNRVPDLAVPLDLTIETTMNILGTLPLAHDPGAKFTYGLNTDVLGRVVEVASGMTLADYFQNNITGPLKMNDTRFFYDDGFAPRLTSAYSINPNDTSLKRIMKTGVFDGDYPVKGAKKYYSGGSGLSSTLHDYFVFCQAILNGGEYNGVRILQDSTVTLMTSDHLGDLRWAINSTFGYGWRINREKDAVGGLGDTFDLGWGGAFSTWFTINPKDKVIEIIATQVLFNPFESEFTYGSDNLIKRSLIQKQTK